KRVFEKKIGDDQMTFVTGCKDPHAVSILIRGGTEHVVDEVERSLEDALSVVACADEDGKVITGGGASAMEIALGLRDYASTVGGREQIAIEAFADAIEIVPRTLSERRGRPEGRRGRRRRRRGVLGSRRRDPGAPMEGEDGAVRRPSVPDVFRRLLERLDRFAPLPAGSSFVPRLGPGTVSLDLKGGQTEPVTDVIEGVHTVFVTIELP